VNELLTELTPLVSHYGLWIVYFGMMLEGTTMIVVTGILCYLGLLSLGEAVPAAILGAVTGDQIWYFLGKRYTNRVMERFPSFRNKVEKLSGKIRNKGEWLAFGGRFIYGGAIIFPLTLGTYSYPYKKFTLLDTAGVSLWAVIGIAIGYIFGTSAEHLFGEIKKAEHLLLLLVFAGIAVWWIRRYPGIGLSAIIKKEKNE